MRLISSSPTFQLLVFPQVTSLNLSFLIANCKNDTNLQCKFFLFFSCFMPAMYIKIHTMMLQFSMSKLSSSSLIVVQSLSLVQLFATPWTAAHWALLSFTISRSLLKFMYIELVMLSNHLILCHCLLLLPSIFPSIKVFSSESSLRIRWPNSGASDSASVLPMNSRG